MANPADVVHSKVKSAVDAIHKVIAARDLKVLKQYKSYLMTGPATKGVHPLALDTGDEDRDLSGLR
jgi:hypothetical protein